MPMAYYASYCSTKIFDDFFSIGLNYELRRYHIDTSSVLPGGVATHLSTFKKNLLLAVISPESCATGTLNKATSI
jgi:short-subunit dehydrogenase